MDDVGFGEGAGDAHGGVVYGVDVVGGVVPDGAARAQGEAVDAHQYGIINRHDVGVAVEEYLGGDSSPEVEGTARGFGLYVQKVVEARARLMDEQAVTFPEYAHRQRGHAFADELDAGEDRADAERRSALAPQRDAALTQ